MTIENYCIYFQATVNRPESWFVVSALKSFEHVCFDRTIYTDESVFEFFVAPAYKEFFIELMAHFEKEGLVHNLQELPNRLADSSQEI